MALYAAAEGVAQTGGKIVLIVLLTHLLLPTQINPMLITHLALTAET